MGFTAEDEKMEAELEAEIESSLNEFSDTLQALPWTDPELMKKLREAGDGAIAKSKKLRKLQRQIYPGERISLTPDPTADLAQNKRGVHPECDNGFKFQNIMHAAGTQHQVALQAHSPAQLEKIFAPKVQCLWDMHQMTAVF